jgi:hypothetical protein
VLCAGWVPRVATRRSTVDGNLAAFRLSPKPDVAAAKAFLREARRTRVCTCQHHAWDGYAASRRAVREISTEDEEWKRTELRLSKYLKIFAAAITIAGVAKGNLGEKPSLFLGAFLFLSLLVCNAHRA